MKRIWLKIRELQIINVGKRETAIYCSMKLGEALIIPGIQITKRADGHLSQNWVSQVVRFIDVPGRHKRKKNELLETILAGALYRRHWGDFGKLMEEENPPKELPAWQPPEWNGDSLRIPVDFIRIYGLEAREWRPESSPDLPPLVIGHLQLGHHIAFWNIVGLKEGELYLRKEGLILDSRVVREISLLLKNKGLREEAETLTKRGRYFSDKNFMLRVRGCDPDLFVLPPVRFY